jgi:hypothetical protein
MKHDGLRPSRARNELHEVTKVMREPAKLDAQSESTLDLDRPERSRSGGGDPLFSFRQSGFEFSAGFVGGDDGAFPERRKGRLRRGQFLAVHAIDPALH